MQRMEQAQTGHQPKGVPMTATAGSRSRLLMVTPWQYQYRGKNEQVTVPICKAMNCVAQALCRTKDSWWKEQQTASGASAASPQ